MRLLDRLRNADRRGGELSELQTLADRLNRACEGAPEAKRRLCEAAVMRALDRSIAPASPIADLSRRLCEALLASEGLFVPVRLDGSPTTAEVWKLTDGIKHRLSVFEEPEPFIAALASFLHSILGGLHALPTPEDGSALSIPLFDFLPNLPLSVEGLFAVAFNGPEPACPFQALTSRLERNLMLASGIDPSNPTSRKEPVPPTKAKDQSPQALIGDYLGGTPFATLLQTPIPFSIPLHARFEHTHIVGGSGHGKTQLLQHLILRDLEQLMQGRGSIVVIDSQGDMLRSIMSLAEFAPGGPLSDRLVFIDPNDIEYPPALNLFDFGLDRLSRYSPLERERLLNGAIALYEYLFGGLLGAELTMRQGVIFRYLARLMMNVPGATIHTMLTFIEDPEAVRPYLPKLDRVTQHFFETQFFASGYKDTRQQILARLWGVLSNSILERMFANERNKLDLFDAMNRGSVILINTAKDLLKQDGCQILGRFFIALIGQAAQERAIIPEDKRRATFVYVDEAHDYFDDSLENLFNQARKYKVGLVIAHQNLDQLDHKLRSTVMASTSIKMVGGLSAGDAGAFAREMQTETEFLQDMRKRHGSTEFACFVRNVTPRPIRLTVPFGQLEARERISPEDQEALLRANRARYASGAEALGVEVRPAAEGGLGQPELL